MTAPELVSAATLNSIQGLLFFCLTLLVEAYYERRAVRSWATNLSLLAMLATGIFYMAGWVRHG